MKHLVVGAGATFAQALDLGVHPADGPPLIRDFARKTWSNYSPYPLLNLFLAQLGCAASDEDPREVFYRLEDAGETNIERFMEFLWQHKNIKIPEIDEYGGFWRNFLYHGLGSPLQYLMLRCFWSDDGWKDFQLLKSVASTLEPADFVLNLNYDTTFELALGQLQKPFCYTPNVPSPIQLPVCKPHGSLNLVASDNEFTFGQPGWLGMAQPKDFESYVGLVPPRLNKNYAQHWIAQMILGQAHMRQPDRMIMWGVGLTESDADLLSLYMSWVSRGCHVDIINPDGGVALRASNLLGCEVCHFETVDAWLRA